MGGSGGGGSSGQVGYPDYIERIHEDWLESAANDTIDASVTEVMNDALGNSPYAAATPYDPDADIATYIAAIGSLDTLIAAFIGTLDLSPTLPGFVSEADITTDVANLEAQLSSLKDARLTGNIIPRFEAGMRDINAVVSSAFVMGRTIIETDADQEVTRDVAAHGSKLRIAVKPTDAQVGELNLRDSELTAKAQQTRVEFEKTLTQLIIEAYRIKIVAKKEESDLTIEYDVTDAKWDLEVFQHGANLLASPAGGTAMAGEKKISATSVIGGGLSGAAAGAMVGLAGGPLAPISVTAGAIVGGLLGIGAGLLG